MLDGTGRSFQNPIYMCMVQMIPRSWYIIQEGGQGKGIGKTPEEDLEKILLLDSRFPMPSSRIMVFNLIAKPSGNTVLT